MNSVFNITAYGNFGFRIQNHGFIKGNTMLACLQEQSFIKEFKLSNNGTIKLNDLAFLKQYANQSEYLIIGCGESFMQPSIEIKKFIKDCNFALEWVNTKFACHTFNDIVSQGDTVIALLISVE